MNLLAQEEILIVDDNPANLAVLSQVLKSVGLKVRVATDGTSAIAQSEYDPPALILLDIMMEGIDGFETCRQLKANLKTQLIPIIFITALEDTEDKVKGLSLGAVDYITKPFQALEVLARVQVHLQLQLLAKKIIQQNQELEKANQQLQYLVNFDGLTQVANRRHFDRYIQQEWGRLQREKQPLSLILCDIDYFKNYNDYYGHPAGDDCLKKVAEALKNAVKRSSDLVCRYGGEEFAIILPNTDLAGAIKITQLIQLTIKELKLVHDRSPINKNITVSLGISSEIPHQQSSVKFLINAADTALYQAKEQGRDRYHLFP
ncbi:Response regulator receiver modulated diguanylate cyclase [Hyella patelloides LEGE 07179]|uniref:Response regulator receiver modulated diguanylate cyclase n=1 Tax=Hyella patelloides LEGE 07179 TaxID=945734 RepID=A0A563VZ52_9CYAN|nr:PleD family two-component system response regulator [Hyella patelloides]VEP16543.1 Response regulator receiver modulated diguanylate cyclase [Hyella patelloides LEGE 07179]